MFIKQLLDKLYSFTFSSKYFFPFLKSEPYKFIITLLFASSFLIFFMDSISISNPLWLTSYLPIKVIFKFSFIFFRYSFGISVPFGTIKYSFLNALEISFHSQLNNEFTLHYK